LNSEQVLPGDEQIGERAGDEQPIGIAEVTKRRIF